MSSQISKQDGKTVDKIKENKYIENEKKEKEDFETDPEESEEIEEIISIPYKPINDSESQPKSICDFIFKEEIGEGTFGHVKLSINKQTGEKVAIKIMEKKKIFEYEDKERVEREIKILKSVRHPNIIHLFSVLQTKENLYLIMEYARGKELYEFILINGKLDELTACCFFQQLISGLEYLHKNNIVHRDIKPENLIVNRRTKELKIVDFGLSNSYKNENNQLLKSSCGSPSYAAPEMLIGKKYKAPLVDIWSSGIVLYAMVCGFLPFEDDNNDILYKKIRKGKFKIPNFISENCKDLIKKILVTDPEKRISIDEIKKHPWFNLYKNNKGKITYYEGLLVNKYVIPIDENIVQFMSKKIGISEENIKISVLMNKHNDITTLYYLFLYKKINSFSNYKSVANLKGDLFKEYISNPENLLSTYNNNYQDLINEKKKYFLNDNKTKTMGQVIGFIRHSQRNIFYNYSDKKPVSVGEFKTVNVLNQEKLKNLDLNKIGNEKSNIICHYQDTVKRRNENKKQIKINLDNYNSYDFSENKLLNLKTERSKNTQEKINTKHKNVSNKENNEDLKKILSSLKKEIQNKGLEKVCESKQEIKIVSNLFFNNVPLKSKYLKKSSKESYIQHFKSNKKKIFNNLENYDKNNNSIIVNNIYPQSARKNIKKICSPNLSIETKINESKQIMKNGYINKFINNINNVENIDEDIKVKTSTKIKFNRMNISNKNIYENQLPNKNNNKNDIKGRKSSDQLEQKTFNYSTNIVNSKTINVNDNSYNITNFSKNKNLKRNKQNKKNKNLVTGSIDKMPNSKNDTNTNNSRKLSSTNFKKTPNKKIIANNSINNISINKHNYIHSELKNYSNKLVPESIFEIPTENNPKSKMHKSIITNLKNNITKSTPKNLLTTSNKSKIRKFRNGIISELKIKLSKKNIEEEKNNKINSTSHYYYNKFKLLNSCHKNSSDVNIIRKFHLSVSENEDLTSPINNTINKISGLLNENENDYYHPFCLSDLHIKNKYILKTDIINSLQQLKLKYKNTGFYFLVSDTKDNLFFHIKIENINHTGFYVVKYRKNKGKNINFFKTIKKIQIQI